MKPRQVFSIQFTVFSLDFANNKIKKIAAIATLFFLTNYAMQAQSPTVTLTPSQHNGDHIPCFGKTYGSITTELAGTNIITYNINGNVGIGTTPQDGVNPQYKLVVEGKIGAREINVKATGAWPDYVFEEDYKLPDLTTLSQYLSINKHLPELPNAANVASNGIDVGIMQMLLLKKIEELYLIVIKQQEEIDGLKHK